MPTISAGNTAEFYCPLASSVTFTPGSGGTMKLGFAVASGSAAIAPQTIGAATSITVSSGATVFAQAVGVDATYTAPAGVDTALQALVSGDRNLAAAPANSLAARQAFGAGSSQVLYRQPWPAVAADVRSANLSVWKTARDAGTAKVALWGHSIFQGDNQNFLGASFYNLVRRYLKQSFPQVAFTFENFGISGTTVAQALSWQSTTNFSFAAPAPTNYREHWQSVDGTLATTAWKTYIQTFSPDLIFVGFDLNESVSATFATGLQALITDINSGGTWSVKRPSIVLVACHTGTDATGVVYECSQIIRDLAAKNSCLLLDAARVYEILTSGIDPAGMPVVSGEFAFTEYVSSTGGSVASLNQTYWQDRVGSAYSPTGTSLREVTSGNPMTTFRKRLAVDGAVQINYASSNLSSVPAVYYRMDPNDANYGANTGRGYSVTISGTTVQAFYRASGGSFVAISGATVTLTAGITGSSTHTMRVEYSGGRHKVTVIATGNEVKTFEFFDHQYLGAGYSGVGFSGTGGGFFNIGAIGNKSNGCILEFGDRMPTFGVAATDAELLGTVNDFSSNTSSYGGNAINHLTGPATKLIYEPALQNVLVRLMAA